MIRSGPRPVLQHLDAPLTLADLAVQAGVSVRTLTRRWRAETGQSPLQWLLAQRIELARNLLEGTDLSKEQVARRAGLGSAPSLRAHLHRALGQSPTIYRRMFRTLACSRDVPCAGNGGRSAPTPAWSG